jgi:hypothetical protein
MRWPGRNTPRKQAASCKPGGGDVTAIHERLPALRTKYDGLVFRSKTEARYGVFLKKLGIVYDYEPEAFPVGRTGYLPDLFLPGQSLIAEVKPSFDADPEGVQKWRDLIQERGKERGVLLLPIRPHDNRFLLIGPDGRGGLWEEDQAQWYCCPAGYHYDVLPWPLVGCDACQLDTGYWHEDPRIDRAFDYARSYKFGRGVTGG